MLILVVALLAVQARLWFSDQGLRETQRLRAAVELQHQENAALALRNDALEAEVQNLRDGLEAAEERARADLGLVREHETFFQLVPVERTGRDPR
ncbi:MAG: cell division protein FtsB [Gammaproteobacteria bacterium]|nr:MAG: cell division protein FtsB [Gammaproteobacteria bacterium]